MRAVATPEVDRTDLTSFILQKRKGESATIDEIDAPLERAWAVADATIMKIHDGSGGGGGVVVVVIVVVVWMEEMCGIVKARAVPCQSRFTDGI
jgi:hypothetical protein